MAPGDSLEVAQEKLATGLAALGGGGEEAATIASLLGYVLGVEAADRFRHVEPEQLKRQIFLAMRRLIERRLQQGPLVLTVENLHWADAASVELLQVVVDRLADQPLMLVATCRPGAELRTLGTTRAAAHRRSGSCPCRRSRAKPCSPPTLASRSRACRRACVSSSSSGRAASPSISRRSSGASSRRAFSSAARPGGRARRARPPPTCRRPSRGSCSPGSTACRKGRGTLSRRPRSSGRCSTRPSSARWRASP